MEVCGACSTCNQCHSYSHGTYQSGIHVAHVNAGIGFEAADMPIHSMYSVGQQKDNGHHGSEQWCQEGMENGGIELMQGWVMTASQVNMFRCMQSCTMCNTCCPTVVCFDIAKLIADRLQQHPRNPYKRGPRTSMAGFASQQQPIQQCPLC